MLVVVPLIGALQSVPPQLATAIIAALPIAELRVAIPIGITVYKMSILSAFFWSVVGTMIPAYIILILLEHTSKWLRAHSKKVDKFLTWLFKRTRHKLQKQVTKHGWWALATFVAIPLPGAGVWTGAVAAFVFGFPKKKALFSMLVGVVASAIIVTILTVGASAFIKAIF
jgi:uncharacterized membrane protein